MTSTHQYGHVAEVTIFSYSLLYFMNCCNGCTQNFVRLYYIYHVWQDAVVMSKHVWHDVVAKSEHLWHDVVAMSEHGWKDVVAMSDQVWHNMVAMSEQV